MRRRSLTRFTALMTAVTMLGSSYLSTVVSADTTAAETGTSTTDGSTSGSTTGSSDESDAETDDRLDRNYTKVSAKYTNPKYTGDPIEINVDDAYTTTDVPSEEDSSVFTSEDTSTTELQGYKDSSSVVELSELGSRANYTFNVEKAGVYLVRFDYLPYDMDSILSVEGTLEVNGETPFFECERLVFENKWLATESDKDRYGNEVSSQPEKAEEWQTKYVMDASYRHADALAIQLDAGENTISFTLTEGAVKLGNIYLEAEKEVEKYKSQKASGDNLITIEAQKLDIRNDSSIHATCEYDPSLYPYKTSKKVLNIIDSTSFSDAGQTITYEVNVEEDGYYYIATNYRQNDKEDYPVFMNVAVDGTIPNTELHNYGFDYNSGFEVSTLSTKDDEKIAVYLEKGTHELSFTITIDLIREALETADRVMNEVNDLSLQITKIAGNNKDKYRDIDVETYIPGIEKTMEGWVSELQDAYDTLSAYSDTKSSGTLSSLNIAIKQLKDLAEEPNKIPYRKAELSSSSSSVNQYIANFITDITANNISFDRIYLYQEDAKVPGKASIWKRFLEAIKRFFSSFTSQDYSVDNADKKHLQVWVNRSRQYLEVIQNMIDTEFTPETGIEVDLSIMPDPNKLILANAAGEAPDVAMAVNYALPYDLAIRGALADMTQFDDYQEVFSQFPTGLLIPGTVPNSETGKLGIYSMPETFYFYVLYYRTDIMKKLGLEVPDTIEDVEAIIPALKNRGLDFFYPTSGTTGQRTLAMTTPLIYQNNGSLYDSETYETTINSDTSVKGLTTLTELYTIYNIPSEITNFYQHFRNGDIPIGVGDYFVYNMLNNAAPEIENSWEIALVPGVEQEDGTINRQTAGGAESEVIFKSDEDDDPVVLTEDFGSKEMNREDASWEFLKWWMGTETQVDFGYTLQSTYGKEFIWNSANKDAFEQLPWKSDAKSVILEAMDNIEEAPRIPGTYMLERELSNTFVAVTISGDNLRTSIDSAVKTINRETERKMEEFGYLDEDGNVLKKYTVPTMDSVKELLGQD